MAAIDTGIKPLRLLIVEDRPHDAELLAQSLADAGYQPAWDRVETEPAYLAALETGPDVILADYALPQFTGLRALALLQARKLDIPFILVSGTIGEELAAEAIRQGANDYLLKDRLARLGAAVWTALEQKRLRETARSAAQQLRETQLRLGALLDNSPALTFVKDLDGRYRHVNRRFVQAFGLKDGDAEGKTDHELFPAAQAALFRGHDESTLAAGKPMEFEETAAFDGGPRTHLVVKFPLVNACGTVEGIGGIATDITDRKRNEALYRATFNQAAVGIAHTALDGRFVRVNDKFCSILGYREDEMVALTFTAITHPEDQPASNGLRAQLLAGTAADASPSREKRYLRKDGSAVWVSIAVALIRTPSGEPDYFMTVVQDISDRKAVEEVFRATFDHAGVGIALSSLDRRYLQVNRKLCEVLGYTHEELLAVRPSDVVHPDDLPKHADNITRLQAGEVDVCDGEIRYVRKDGTTLWVSRTITVVRDAGGKPQYFIRVIEDITQRRRIEEALQESERFAKSTIDGLSQHLCVLDEAGVILAVNSAWQAFAVAQGADPGQVGVGANYLTACDTATGEEREHGREFAAGIRAVLAGDRRDYKLEYPCATPDQQRWFLARVTRFHGGGPSRAVVIHTDITARKAQDMKIAGLSRIHSVLSGINSLIVRAHDRQELFDGACKIAVEDGQFGMAYIGLHDGRTQAVNVVAIAGIDPGHFGVFTAAQSSSRADVLQGQGAVGRAIREKHAIICNDIRAEADVGGGRRREAIRLGYRSLIALPLIVEGVAIGNLSLYSKVKDFFNEEEVNLLNELAADVSFALEHINKEEKIARLSRVQAVTSEINSLIVRIRDRQELFDEVCRIAVEHGRFETAWIGTYDAASRTAASVACAGPAGQNLTWINNTTWEVDVATGAGVGSRAIREKRPAFDNDIAADTTVRNARRQAAIREGFRSMIALPFLAGGEVLGQLSLYSKQAHHFDDEEVKLLAELAGNISLALDHIARQEQLEYLSYYDVLTGLPNRTLLQDRLRQTLVQAQRNHWIVGVLFIDLDGFKTVNDTLGHVVGDKLLQLASSRLKECVRSGDTIARFGGDEFSIILSDLADAQHARLVAQKILDAFTRPFVLDGHETYITTSIGITLYPGDSEDMTALIKNADAAMYGAKTAGRNTYQFYTAEMNENAVKKLQLEARLRRALERQEFILHYQPKVDIISGEIAGVEALIRWQSPETGLVPPLDFIPLLEETGLIVPVGEWVLRAACEQIVAWRRAGIEPVPVAINLSCRQFQQPGLDRMIAATLQEFEVHPRWIEIEITESALMQKPDEAIAVLQSLRGQGIRISVDDFGTGYSSLSYLKRLPLDALKVDRSFVRDITTDPDSAAIARAIVTMAHSLSLKVVAEGVETKEQLAYLSSNGCDDAQGYLFSKPLASADCADLLANKRQRFKPVSAAATAGDTPTVLLVDDDRTALLLLEDTLEKDGYRIVTASSPQRALEFLALHKVDMIVSDHNMPGMSGIELFKRVRRMYPHIVRIMLSGQDDAAIVMAAINEGEVYKFFVKQRDDHLLRGEIRKALFRDAPVGELSRTVGN
jgi:diguanylate cyclase (GGDEF)-like protein/PAS domain S-box-containing protein